MSIIRKYHEVIKYDLNQSKGEIIEKLTLRKNKRSYIYGFLTDDQIDLLEVKPINESDFEIPIEPTMFNPFKGTGKIIISLKDNRLKSGTEITTEIIPYSEGFIVTVYLVFTFLLLLTLVGLLISINKNTVLIIALGWTIFPFILYVTPFQNRTKLRKYRNSLIGILKKKSSR